MSYIILNSEFVKARCRQFLNIGKEVRERRLDEIVTQLAEKRIIEFFGLKCGVNRAKAMFSRGTAPAKFQFEYNFLSKRGEDEELALSLLALANSSDTVYVSHEHAFLFDPELFLNN